MTLDLSTTFPSAETQAARYLDKDASYLTLSSIRAFAAAISEKRLDVFKALVDHYQAKTEGGTIFHTTIYMLDEKENCFHYNHLYEYRDEQSHDTFITPAIRYLLSQKACSRDGLNVLLEAMIKYDDFAMFKETLDHASASPEHKIFFRRHFRELVAKDEKWMTAFVAAGNTYTAQDIMHYLENNARADVAFTVKGLPQIVIGLSQEERNRALQYVNNGQIMQALVEKHGADTQWVDPESGLKLMDHLMKRPNKARSAIEYITAHDGRFRHEKDAVFLEAMLATRDAAKMITVVVNGKQPVSLDAFLNAADFQGLTPQAFFASLPEHIRSSEHLAMVRIELIQTSAAKQAHQLSDTRDGAKHADPERGGE